jgi:hypothetical protein
MYEKRDELEIQCTEFGSLSLIIWVLSRIEEASGFAFQLLVSRTAKGQAAHRQHQHWERLLNKFAPQAQEADLKVFGNEEAGSWW